MSEIQGQLNACQHRDYCRELETKLRWRPVSQEPKEVKNYLVTDGSEWTEIVCFEEGWCDFDKIITHWWDPSALTTGGDTDE